jgi:hypothetical protein
MCEARDRTQSSINLNAKTSPLTKSSGEICQCADLPGLSQPFSGTGYLESFRCSDRR